MSNQSLIRAIKSLNLSAIKTATTPKEDVFLFRYIEGEFEKDKLDGEWIPLRTDGEIEKEYSPNAFVFNYIIPEKQADNDQ